MGGEFGEGDRRSPEGIWAPVDALMAASSQVSTAGLDAGQFSIMPAASASQSGSFPFASVSSPFKLFDSLVYLAPELTNAAPEIAQAQGHTRDHALNCFERALAATLNSSGSFLPSVFEGPETEQRMRLIAAIIGLIAIGITEYP